ALKKEHHVIDELDRDLPVNTQHRSVDVDQLTCPQGYSHRLLRQSASRMRRLMSISCIMSFDFSSRRRAASLRTHSPIEIMSARSLSGSAFSGLARSSMKVAHSRRM